jgi:hypothetical protein
MKPSVGRIVHYRKGDECQAAIVTEVTSEGGDVTLQVFPANGQTGQVWAGEDQDGRENSTWHWPEKI